MTRRAVFDHTSEFTWHLIAGTMSLGNTIREDGLTSFNLAVIKSVEPEVDVTLFSARSIEPEYGADWIWSVSAPGGTRQVCLVQAKKLDPVFHRYTGFKKEQTDRLILAAQEIQEGTDDAQVESCFVFYNCVNGVEGLSPADWGCTFAKAENVRNQVGERRSVKFQELRNIQRPWREIFGAGAAEQATPLLFPRRAAHVPQNQSAQARVSQSMADDGTLQINIRLDGPSNKTG